MAAGPLKFYRVWCGQKRYSGWLPTMADAFSVAIDHGLAFPGVNNGPAGLGPLTWIEVGTRKYARSRTVPVQK